MRPVTSCNTASRPAGQGIGRDPRLLDTPMDKLPPPNSPLNDHDYKTLKQLEAVDPEVRSILRDILRRPPALIAEGLDPGEIKHPPGHPLAIEQTARQLIYAIDLVPPIAYANKPIVQALVAQARRDIAAETTPSGGVLAVATPSGKPVFREDIEREAKMLMEKLDRSLGEDPLGRSVRNLVEYLVAALPGRPVQPKF